MVKLGATLGSLAQVCFHLTYEAAIFNIFLINLLKDVFAFANNFGVANIQRTRRQFCPGGCYRPMPGEPCFQGNCPDGCCEMV